MAKEKDIENDLITQLQDLKYIIRPDIHNRATLEANFRQKFEELNQVNLTDNEFARLLQQITIPTVYEAARHLRERNTFEREDGTPLHYTLVNIKDWCKNTFEVTSQLRINTDYTHHRYDVMLLINGIPVVQIELKGLTVTPRKAMQQIVEYKQDPGNGYTRTLLCYVQMFIVSNQTSTYYFANNDIKHFAFNADERFLPIYQYADRDNKKISHLADFAKNFLAKCTLGEMVSRYMVLVASEKKLLMMRPYQIYAVKAIVESIKQNTGNGYIWHTTGSGKTLTSFKASTLLKDNSDIDKCLFVVDRKDLDRQTREEFNKFQEGCVEENTNTATLVNRLLSTDYADKVIVTTIQKLGLALDPSNKNNYAAKLAPLKQKRIVFIFDECHRSQFGENHQAIKNFFPNSQLFGFTGTPIFEDNAVQIRRENQDGFKITTEHIFPNRLHSYTITHAIEDKNVLKFHVDFYRPEQRDGALFEEELKGEIIGDSESSTDAITLIDYDQEPMDPHELKKAIVHAILAKHPSSTSRRKFNALFATASINDAIEYYDLFKKIQADKKKANPDYEPLRIACVFSPPAEGNADVRQIQEDLPQELEDNQVDPEGKKAALTAIISDYNACYNTNHRISEFDAYYQDVQKRIKDQQFPNSDLSQDKKVDIVIVVDMLLTGFDSKYLNTLYVDKNLKYHGLIQAFSRTNRVLNDSKPHGHIVDFRGQQETVDEAIRLFSGDAAAQPSRIWIVDPAPEVIEKFKKAVDDLRDFMESHDLEFKPEDVVNLKGDFARAEFINKFKEIQRLKTQLDQYTDLTEEQLELVNEILPEDTHKGFKSGYLETARQLQETLGGNDDSDSDGGDDGYGNEEDGGEGIIIKDPDGDGYGGIDIEQLDFEFVLFASAVIDYDYILNLIASYTQKEKKDRKQTKEQMVNELLLTIRSDSQFMDEREEISSYIKELDMDQPLYLSQLRDGYYQFKNRRFRASLETIANEHSLAPEALETFVNGILQRMVFDGQNLSELLAPLDLGWKDRKTKEEALMHQLIPLLKKKANGREISGLSVYEH